MSESDVGMVPSDRTVRRRLLASIAAVGTVGLAGCSGSASSEGFDCSTKAVDRGDGEILQQAAAMVDGESVVLRVTLREQADALPVESVQIRDTDGALVAEIPTTDAREYRITIGSPPHHGRLGLLAEDEQRVEIDSLEIEYHCTPTE